MSASSLTDKELVAEFLKRFAVPQFYSRECIEMRLEQMDKIRPDEKITDDEWEKIQNFITGFYETVDEIIEENYLCDFRDQEEGEED